MAEQNITKEQAAYLARNTIVMAEIAESFSPERVSDLLAEQRELIAKKLEEHEEKT